ncbi:hypothetical protein COOONC_15012 [Cooperia oncophora]
MLFRQYGNGLIEGECPTADGVVPAIKQITHALDKDSLDLGPLASHLRDVVAERLACIIDVNHEEFDGTYIQATALNPQLAVLLTEQQLSYARSAIEQELHSRQPTPTSSLTMDALLASVLSSSPDSLPLYTDLLPTGPTIATRTQRPADARSNHRGCTVVYFGKVVCNDVRHSGHFGTSSKLLSNIPTATVTAASLLSSRSVSPFQKPDPIPILSHLDKPEKLDRNLLLRFNRKFYTIKLIRNRFLLDT